MAERSVLDIRGQRGRVVPNIFYSGASGAAELSILFAGWQYGTDLPLFYYTRNLLLARGADVLAVDFRYASEPAYARLSEQKRQEWFLEEVDSVYQAAQARAHQRLTVVAKSFSTMAMAHLVLDGRMDEQTRLVWLTPVLEAESIRETLRSCRYPSLLAIGSRDPGFDRTMVRKLAKNKNLDLLILEKGDHSLEIPGDVPRSLDLLSAYLTRLTKFLGAAGNRKK